MATNSDRDIQTNYHFLPILHQYLAIGGRWLPISSQFGLSHSNERPFWPIFGQFGPRHSIQRPFPTNFGPAVGQLEDTGHQFRRIHSTIFDQYRTNNWRYGGGTRYQFEPMWQHIDRMVNRIGCYFGVVESDVGWMLFILSYVYANELEYVESPTQLTTFLAIVSKDDDDDLLFSLVLVFLGCILFDYSPFWLILRVFIRLLLLLQYELHDANFMLNRNVNSLTRMPTITNPIRISIR